MFTLNSRENSNQSNRAKNNLSREEREKVIEICNSQEFASCPPNEIVPKLADSGKYLASERTFYRVLKEFGQLHHRGRAAAPRKNNLETHCATGKNQVWMWDITYLKSQVKGMFYYLYMIIDLFDRSIVGFEVHEEESAEKAAELIKRVSLAQGRLSTQKTVLHSDNGSPMKGATMLAMLYNLGITPSNSRPRVSNDNAYAESIFKTMKYRVDEKPLSMLTRNRFEYSRAFTFNTHEKLM